MNFKINKNKRIYINGAKLSPETIYSIKIYKNSNMKKIKSIYPHYNKKKYLSKLKEYNYGLNLYDLNKYFKELELVKKRCTKIAKQRITNRIKFLRKKLSLFLSKMDYYNFAFIG
jgi:hypothetical protein